MVQQGAGTFEQEFVCYLMSPSGSHRMFSFLQFVIEDSYDVWERRGFPFELPYDPLDDQITEEAIV